MDENKDSENEMNQTSEDIQDDQKIDESTSDANDSRVKKKSPAWAYFENKDSQYAACILCNTKVKHSGGTSNLFAHLSRNHRVLCSGILKEKTKRSYTSESSGESTAGEEPPTKRKKLSSKSKLSRIDEVFEKANSFSEGGERSDRITAALMFMITKDDEPLSIVDKEGFNFLMKVVAPLYHVLDRKTLTQLIDNRYIDAKKAYKSTLQKALPYTLTCDNWTDCTFQSYLGVTIHYLSEDLLMKDGCLGVFPLHTNNTGPYLAECLNNVIDDFNLDRKKIMAVVTDGAANIKLAAKMVVGSDKHIWCFAHFLSHLVPNVLKDVPEIESIITMVKKIVVLIRRSVVATDELKRLQISDGKTDGTTLKFILDVPPRWNSTLYMLERFLELEQYVYAVIFKCTRKDIPDMLTRTQIEVLREVVALMKPVELVIKEISGSSYPTSSVIIPITYCMKASIEEVDAATDEANIFKSKLVSAIEQKFRGIEEKTILAVPTILDPRFKRMHFRDPDALESAIEQIDRELREIDVKKTEKKADIVEKSKKINSPSLWKVHDDLISRSSDERRSEENLSSELKEYLKLPAISRLQDPFEHWKSLKLSFSTLYEVAIRHVSIISTSVPAERIFSDAGNIKRQDRNRLTGKSKLTKT